MNRRELNAELVRRYTDQPERMPRDIRKRIENAFNGRPVLLYALTDLDAEMRLVRRWLALGQDHVAVVDEREGHTDEGDGPPPNVQVIDRARVSGTRTRPGLSCTVLTLQGEPGEADLAVVRYTHRQRRAVENVQYALDKGDEARDQIREDADSAYADAVARPVRSAQASVHVNRMAVVWRLLSYLGPYKRKVAVGTAAAVAMTLISLVPPYLTGYLIDGVFKPFESGALERPAAWRAAWITTGVIALVFIMTEFLAWARLRVMATLGEEVARDIRTELYEHLQRLSLGYYSKKKTGSIISRVTSDSDRLWHFIAFGVVELSLAFVTMAGLGAVLIHMDWILGLVMVAPLPLVMWMLARHSRRMQEICLRAWRKWSGLTGHVADSVSGVRVIKAFSQEAREKRRFDGTNAEVTAEFNGIHMVWTSFWPRLMGIVRGLMIAVWVIALPRVLSGGEDGAWGLSTGTFVSFLLYMTMFLHPIYVMGQMTEMANRATSSAHRIFEVLDTEPDVRDAAEPVLLASLRGEVEFDNVSFSYDGVRLALSGVSFAVRPGEMIGLVGPSGAGKSTVVNLIVRFYEATGGRVLIDGVDLSEIETESYRRRIGMVLQDPFLFHGTILDNIRYGAPETDVERVVQAARAANAHDFVCKLPQGYETVVGERGHTLSGGERQRVSIARAILNDPKILILDEATSSVDTETECRIQEALDRLVPGRTVFAIAHRLSTLKKADRLFVIEDGKLTEVGTHAELLAKPEGTYRKLCEMQRELHEVYAV